MKVKTKALLLFIIISLIGCKDTSNEAKYPQRYPQEAHNSVIKALQEKDYSYFNKHLLNPKEKDFWKKADTSVYDSLLSFLFGIDTNGVQVTGYAKNDGTASLFGKNGEALYHYNKDKWFFTTGFPPFNGIDDPVKVKFELGERKEAIRAPTRNTYLIKTDSIFILLKSSDIVITHHSIKVSDKYLNYSLEASDIKYTIFNKDFEELSSEKKSISNGYWSPFSRISWEVIRELLPFESTLKIDDLSIHFSYNTIASWWLSFSMNTEIAMVSEQFKLNENSLKNLIFKKVNMSSSLTMEEDCD